MLHPRTDVRVSVMFFLLKSGAVTPLMFHNKGEAGYVCNLLYFSLCLSKLSPLTFLFTSHSALCGAAYKPELHQAKLPDPS